MNKKILLFTSIGIVFATGVAALSISGANQMNKLRAGDSTNDYTIVFTSEHVQNVQKDTEYGWFTSFDLVYEKAIDMGANKYDLSSRPYDGGNYGTYVYGDCDNVTFKQNSHILDIESAYYDQIYVLFRLIKRANIVLSSSFIEYYVVTRDEKGEIESKERNQVCFNVYDNTDPSYNEYQASLNLSDSYGTEMYIKTVQLCFSCAK